MLQTVAIRGYRSLREVIVPLGGLSIVTGANGAGKSSLYRALRLLADCGRGEVIGSLAREGGLQSVLWAGPEQLGGRRQPPRGDQRQGRRRDQDLGPQDDGPDPLRPRPSLRRTPAQQPTRDEADQAEHALIVAAGRPRAAQLTRGSDGIVCADAHSTDS